MQRGHHFGEQRRDATELALKAYQRALEPKRLAMIEGGHFDPCRAELETASRAAIDWFKALLR